MLVEELEPETALEMKIEVCFGCCVHGARTSRLENFWPNACNGVWNPDANSISPSLSFLARFAFTGAQPRSTPGDSRRALFFTNSSLNRHYVPQVSVRKLQVSEHDRFDSRNDTRIYLLLMKKHHGGRARICENRRRVRVVLISEIEQHYEIKHPTQPRLPTRSLVKK